jgi:hypothetical protein
MKRFTKALLSSLFLASSLTTTAFAETNPFAACDRAPGDVSRLNCRISIVDDYIKQYLGAEAFEKAERLAEEKCVHKTRVNMSPKLILLRTLDCKFNTKLDFYENSGQ